MVRDAVANVVYRLGECGYPPRKVGKDSWESRCPVHRGSDYSLSITRNEFNHVVLECRTAANCQHTPIIRALGYTNDHVYAETPDWLIGRLSGIPIHKAEIEIPEAHVNHEHGPASAELASGSGEAAPPCEKGAEPDVIPAIDDSSRPLRAESEVPAEPASALGSHGASPHCFAQLPLMIFADGQSLLPLLLQDFVD